jgi:hypothetical protein
MNFDFKNAPIFTGHILSGSTPARLWSLLKDNQFRIHPRFWPKFILSFLISIQNLPFFYLEKAWYGKKIKATKVQSPVFILGYPRSGTTYLYYLISRDPQFGYVKTWECMGPWVLFTFGKVLRQIAKLALPSNRPMDGLEMGADVPMEAEFAMSNLGLASLAHGYYFPQNFRLYFDRYVLFKEGDFYKESWKNNFDYLLKKLTLKNGGKRLVLKSPFDTARLDAILKLYPDAKFIYLKRNPVDVYGSNEKLFESILPGLSFQKVKEESIREDIFYTYAQTLKKYKALKGNIKPGHLIELNFESFVQNQESTLQSIYQQLNLKDFETAFSFIKKEMRNYDGYKKGEYDLGEEVLERINEVWKEG